MAPLNVGVGLGIRPPAAPKPPGRTPPDVAAFRNFPAAGGWSVLSHPGVAQQFTQHNVGLFAPGGPGPGTPHPGTVPNAQHPQNSATAQPGASSPTGGGSTSQGNPALDPTYFANVAANHFKVTNQVNALGLQGTQADTALQQALGQLAYQQPRDQLALEQKANQGGGLYSSVYDQNLGNLGHSYLDKQSAAVQSNTNTHDTLNQQIAALLGGEPIYNAQQAADSTGRAARLAALNPGLGQGTGGLNTNPGATKPGGSTPGTKPPVSNRAGKNAKGRLTVKVGTALGGGKGLNVGRTLPTLSGKPSAPSKNPPTTIRRSPGLGGRGVVRTRLGGR